MCNLYSQTKGPRAIVEFTRAAGHDGQPSAASWDIPRLHGAGRCQQAGRHPRTLQHSKKAFQGTVYSQAPQRTIVSGI